MSGLCQFCGRYIVLTTDDSFYCPTCGKYQVWTAEELEFARKKAEKYHRIFRVDTNSGDPYDQSHH